MLQLSLPEHWHWRCGDGSSPVLGSVLASCRRLKCTTSLAWRAVFGYLRPSQTAGTLQPPSRISAFAIIEAGSTAFVPILHGEGWSYIRIRLRTSRSSKDDTTGRDMAGRCSTRRVPRSDRRGYALRGDLCQPQRQACCKAGTSPCEAAGRRQTALALKGPSPEPVYARVK